VHGSRTTLSFFGGAGPAEPTETDTDPAEPRDGPHLRRYRIGRLVGVGGMGRVYEAFDALLERSVALKVMRADVPASERRRFRREAILGARLLHPGLVRVYDMGLGDDGEAEWMAMEYLPGTDLLRLVDGARARRQPLGWPAIVRALTQVLGALQYCHDSRVVHRDIKPANMFLTRDPNTRYLTTKLLDLGVALDLDGPRRDPRAVEVLCGDPNYIAPEQTLSPHVDGRADLYAVGMSLYELTTGVLPYEALAEAPLADLLAAHRDAEPAPPSSCLPADTPPALAERIDQVFARACAKRPDDRYVSAREMQAALAAPVSGV
jgi:serine/threonine protein kinase